MADYIKRIQSRLSRQDIKQNRTVLINAVTSLGFDHTNLTEDEVNNLTNLLADKYSTELAQKIDEGDAENSASILTEHSAMEDKNTTEIVVSSEGKQELITTQAAVLGVELSGDEVVKLAAKLGDSFSNYAEFIQETALTIKTYVSHRYDSLEQKISETSEDLKHHFQHRDIQLSQKLATELGEIGNFFRGKSEERKELSKAITAAFKI